MVNHLILLFVTHHTKPPFQKYSTVQYHKSLVFKPSEWTETHSSSSSNNMESPTRIEVVLQIIWSLPREVFVFNINKCSSMFLFYVPLFSDASPSHCYKCCSTVCFIPTSDDASPSHSNYKCSSCCMCN